MTYDLWDVDIGKFIARFNDEEPARALVKSLIDQYGPEYAASLAIGRVQDDGTILPPLAGVDLAALGWTLEDAARIRGQLQTFADDWDDPAMDVYDAL